MRTLAEWLESIGCFDVRPCQVAIGKSVYSCARYKQRLQTPENSQAWTRGEREYVREQVYCLGELPSAYKRSRKTCFRFIDDSRDWYVSCHAPKNVAADPKYAEYHPFGESFQLAPWSVPDATAIDHYEPKPYARIGASVDYR